MSTESARFPRIRMRRSRARGWSRDLVREHRLSPADFLWPVFVI
jgi:porphobilinogen synthase